MDSCFVVGSQWRLRILQAVAKRIALIDNISSACRLALTSALGRSSTDNLPIASINVQYNSLSLRFMDAIERTVELSGEHVVRLAFQICVIIPVHEYLERRV